MLFNKITCRGTAYIYSSIHSTNVDVPGASWGRLHSHNEDKLIIISHTEFNVHS